MKKFLAGIALSGAFLLPFLGWISAEPVPYRDPEGFFSFLLPEGWLADESSYMGKGVVAKGPAGASGLEPSIHLTHEPAGIITLEVQWQTVLARLRYELARVKYRSIEDFEDKTPPYHQATYSYTDGEKSFLSIIRLSLHQGRFFLLSASSPEEEFEALRPLFLSTFDSLRHESTR